MFCAKQESTPLLPGSCNCLFLPEARLDPPLLIVDPSTGHPLVPCCISGSRLCQLQNDCSAICFRRQVHQAMCLTCAWHGGTGHSGLPLGPVTGRAGLTMQGLKAPELQRHCWGRFPQHCSTPAGSQAVTQATRMSSPASVSKKAGGCHRPMSAVSTADKGDRASLVSWN